MAEEPGRNGATRDQVLQARRLQELFKGRFEEDEALLILEHNEWNINQAVNFVFTEPPDVVRQVSGAGDNWQFICADGVARNLALRNEIGASVRQYACGECDNVWWRKVPYRKMVSSCKRCKRRYEAVPKNREWGWGKFQCVCGAEFHGYASMDDLFRSPCYACRNMCRPLHIIPPSKSRRRGRGRRNEHSCNAQNCFNRAMVPGPAPTMCVHPRSLQHQVLYPSQRHISTGSTVATFISQGDLGSLYGYPGPRAPDIPEESDEGD